MVSVAMFCKWDADLKLKVVKQSANSKTYGLPKQSPYTIQRIYNGSVVGYMGEFTSSSEAYYYLANYAMHGPQP